MHLVWALSTVPSLRVNRYEGLKAVPRVITEGDSPKKTQKALRNPSRTTENIGKRMGEEKKKSLGQRGDKSSFPAAQNLR